MVSGSDLLAALRTASVRPITVCGMAVHVRGLTGAERRVLADRARDGSPLQAHELVALCLCQPDGSALFTEAQVAELANVDGAEVEAVAAEILRASKLLAEDAEAAAKN